MRKKIISDNFDERYFYLDARLELVEVLTDLEKAPFFDETYKRMIELLLLNCSQKDIAEMLNLSRSKVCRMMKKIKKFFKK